MHCLKRFTVSTFELFTVLYQIKKRVPWNLNVFLELNIPQAIKKKSSRETNEKIRNYERNFYLLFFRVKAEEIV